MIAGAYARKSNEQDGRDDDAKSVTRQVERAREFAAKKGWTFSEEHVYIDDAVSGAEWSERERRAWFTMKRAIGAGDANAGKPPFDVLIVANQSRIGRDAQRVPFEITQVEECDIAIWSYLDNRRVTVLDEQGEIEVAIKSIADSFQRRSASKFSMDELKRRAASGKIAGGKIYGYANHRPHPGAAVERVIDQEQAKVITRVFELVADGWGYGRIAAHLNAQKIAGPKTLGLKEQAKLQEQGIAPETPRWSLSGVRELLRPARVALYAEGKYTWGRSKRSRKKGSKLRLQRAAGDENVITVQDDAWKIVEPDLARRALARIADYNASVLRAGVGEGRARTQFVAKPERRGAYLLSGFLRCGARTPEGQTCSAPMTISVRGKSSRRVWACSAYREKKGTCTNAGAVAVDLLDEAVLASLRETFSAERFEQYLGEQAVDTAKIEEQRALRARLIDEELPRLAKVVERLTKRLASIDDDDVASAVQQELKQAVQERRQVEAQVADIEAQGRALEDRSAEVERLRQVWGSWAGALADGARGPELLVRARSLLKKVLATPIWVRPDGDAWRFVGVSRYDRVLAGGLTGNDGFYTEERPGAVDPDELFLWFAEAAGVIPPQQRKGHIKFHCVDFEPDEPEPTVIAGGSDAGDEVPGGRANEMAPHTPPRSARPGPAGSLLDLPSSTRRGPEMSFSTRRGPEMAPHTSQRSARPGQAGSLLDMPLGPQAPVVVDRFRNSSCIASRPASNAETSRCVCSSKTSRPFSSHSPACCWACSASSWARLATSPPRSSRRSRACRPVRGALINVTTAPSAAPRRNQPR